jgi:hypothetical protein
VASRRRQQWASYTCAYKCAACSSASCCPVVRTWRVRKLPATASKKLLSTHVNSTRPPGSGVTSLASSNRTLSTGTYVFSMVRCECISRDEAQVSPPAIRGCSLTANSPTRHVPAHSEDAGHVRRGAVEVHLSKRAFASAIPFSMPPGRDYVIWAPYRRRILQRVMLVMLVVFVRLTACDGCR